MKWESASKHLNGSINKPKNTASSKGLKEVPTRKKPVPTLQIPPEATPEEVIKLTREFMDRLRLMGGLPVNEQTSKLGADATGSSGTVD